MNMRFRSVWISDLHLGNKDCKAAFLVSFLQNVECDTLYLLGDIIDLWSMKRRFLWPTTHYDVLKLFVAKAQAGTRVVYIPGNHDEPLRDFIGHQISNVEMHYDTVHETADGKKFLLFHGDILDTYIRVSRFNRLIGDSAYDFLLFVHRWVDKVRVLFDMPYWSLASQIKTRIPNAMQAIRMYEEAALYEGVRRGFDGVVCGHIHHPEHRSVTTNDGEKIYCNTGDWIENCSALVEHENGTLELLDWNRISSLLIEKNKKTHQPITNVVNF